jgi:aminoglycoside 6'-N-acetyltransferase
MTRSYPADLVVDHPLPVRLRLTTPADAALITAWLGEEPVHRWWGGAPVPLAEVEEKHTGRRAPGVVTYLVEAAGRPVGLLQAWQDDDACGLDLFVAAAEQGRGVGPVAARALAEDLTARGWRDLTVDPAVENTVAVRAWERAGFVATGEQGDDGGRATLVMVFVPATGLQR